MAATSLAFARTRRYIGNAMTAADLAGSDFERHPFTEGGVSRFRTNAAAGA
ncbi:hypothetical protein [Bradyrhizobium macuxiense]|uniref:hypothetical protein n=1 Tax=Bradyrhizobium macuxiense TaxID=1755647 RepID=UPI001366377E|nr:hypothetical protein [Bradyrhizobium macuxiense]